MHFNYYKSLSGIETTLPVTSSTLGVSTISITTNPYQGLKLLADALLKFGN